MCDWADIGFITEAGQDLVAAVTVPNTTSALLPGGYGWWNCSSLKDGQAGVMDCKNLIFSKRKLIRADVYYESGAESYRYPAAGHFTDAGGPRILLVSLHATSGGGGVKNSDELFDHLDSSPRRRHGADVVLVGGDMNCRRRHFIQPAAATHQSNSVLDGFAYEVYDNPRDEEFSVQFGAPSVPTLGGELKLKTTAMPGPLAPGCYNQLGGAAWIRVSDHTPVVCGVEVGESSSMHKAKKLKK